MHGIYKNMIEQTINEIRAAVDNKLYFVALMGALTLPDICGKAEYPNKKTSDRYKSWLRQCVNSREFGKYEYTAAEGVDDEIIYKLRCNLLHQGTPNIEERIDNVDYFELVKVNPCKCHKFQHFIENEIEKTDGAENIIARKISINIASLCYLLCDSAEMYYKKNREKFKFIKYNLVDVDYHSRDMFKVEHRNSD